MQKIINDRPLFYCFLAFGFGILFARPIFSLQILPSVFIFACLSVILCLCLKYKKFVSICLIAVSFLIGLFSFFVSEKSFECKSYDGNNIISGRVCVASITNNNQNIILDSVYINGQKIDKRVYVYIFNCTEMEEGVAITFEGELKNTSLYTLNNFNGYYYKNKVGYTSSVNFDDITVVSSNNLSWGEKLKLSIKYHLFKNMNEEEASICYASLFGDKTLIPASVKENFSVSGMAHMLAVSGLHVGFLVAFLSMLLKMLKIKKFYKLAILSSILAVYCYLCAFSASVVRASIMFIILNLSSIFGKKYDRLNSWGLAGIICLFIRPLSVYDGGFLLSFGCVLCILMFAKPLEQKFVEWKVPKKLASTLGLLIPVQFALIPLLSVFFTKISLLSIFANFICVPLFEFFFILLLCLLPIVLIIPILGFVLTIPKTVIGVIINFAAIISSAQFAIVNLSQISSLIIIGVYMSLFLFSHYINAKIKIKGTFIWCLCLFATACGILGTYRLMPSNQKITVLNGFGTTYVLELNNITLAIGEFDGSSINLTENYLNMARLYNANYYISLNGCIPSKETTCFKTIYSCATGNEKYLLNKNQQLENSISLTPIYVGSSFVGIMLEFDNYSYLFCSSNKITDVQIAELAFEYSNINFIAGNLETVNQITKQVNCQFALQDGTTIFNVGNNKYTNMSGNWTISLKQDNIVNMRGVD